MNLIGMDEHKARALKDLTQLHGIDDSKATVATVLNDVNDSESGYKTEIINNINPLWKQRGFASKLDVAALITKNGGKI